MEAWQTPTTGLYDAKAFVNNAESLTSGTKVKLTVVMDQVKGVLNVPVETQQLEVMERHLYTAMTMELQKKI